MTRNLLVDNFRRTRNQRATGSLDDGWTQLKSLKPLDRLTARAPLRINWAARRNCGDGPECPARVSVELRKQ